MTPLTLEEFAFRVLWLEHMRLSQFISEHEAQKHFRKTLAQCRRGDNMLLRKDGTRSEWTVIVEARYRYYLEDLQDQNNAPDSPCAAMHFLTDAMKHVLEGSKDMNRISIDNPMLETLKDIDLRATQARLASQIGRQSKQHQIDFLLGELGRLQAVARKAIADANGGDVQP